ncbi:membrane protein [Bacteroidia bacterium]|nr:membrane protein [Bacteroidia bacterium]
MKIHNTQIIVLCFVALISDSLHAQQTYTLEQCKEMAVKSNLQAKNAELSIEIATQQKKETFTKYFPTVSGTGLGFAANKGMMSMEMNLAPMMAPLEPTLGWLVGQGALDPALLGNNEPVKIEALRNGMMAGIMAVQPVFAGGQIINGNRLAKAGIEIRQLQRQMTDNEVLLTIERYFWQIVSLNEKMKTINNSEKMLDRILSDVKVAVEAGLTTRNDLVRVEVEKNRLESGKLKVANGMTMLKISLAQKIGVPADNFDIQQPDFGEIIPPLTRNDSSTIQNRPEYKLLEKSVDIAHLQHKMEVGKHLPTVAVGAGYNYMNFDRGKSSEMKNDFGLAFATVSIPISDWWGGSHALKRKKLELQQAENTKNESAELLAQQVQNIQNELNEAYGQVLLARKSILSAEENLKISQDNFNAGITILSDLLDAQNLLQQSRDTYTEAATTYFVKTAEWRQISEY